MTPRGRRDAAEGPGLRRVAAGDLLERLLRAYGPQGWWPAETPFEMCVGAVLTQNTAWRNVERAIASLKGAGLLAAGALAGCPPARLERLIRPAGTFRQKARTLRTVAAFVQRSCGGDPRRLAARPAAEAREQLLGLHGVGPETADSILLYAAGVPLFVLDAYTRRVAQRHALDGAGSDESLRAFFETGLPREARSYGEAHALLVRVGKERCRKGVPLCGGCPLEPLLSGAAGGEGTAGRAARARPGRRTRPG